MADFRLSADAEAELDRIWLHIAHESGSIDIATRVVEDITERFLVLARYPHIGRRRDDIAPELRSFSADEYLIIHRVARDGVVEILHVVHGSSDVGAIF